MLLTNVLLKKAKSKYYEDKTGFWYQSCKLKKYRGLFLSTVEDRNIMVMMESIVTGHRFNTIRERLADKLELIRFDPFIQRESIYKEKKKIRSIK